MLTPARLRSSFAANIIFLSGGIAFLLITPLMSRLTGLPVYYIEPMRWIALIGVIHFNRWSAYAMALLLPFISFIIFKHPAVDKAAIIAFELTSNIFLFLWFTKKPKAIFFSMLIAVIASKVICYLIYLAAYDKEFFNSETTPDFLVSQLIVSVLVSFYAWFWLSSPKKSV